MLLDPMSRPTMVFAPPKPNMCPPYRAPAAARAALGFFLPRPSPTVLLRSIQESRIVFLNFQRFPSLKAGIFSSYTYLYNVSGLTPRYWDACRMFITSRDSAIDRKP